MSKQSENKEKQGFQKKCPCCGNCDKFHSQKIETTRSWTTKAFIEETELRCSLGGFKVGKGNWCLKHSFNVTNQ